MLRPLAYGQYAAIKRSCGGDLLAFDLQDGHVTFVGEDADVAAKVLGLSCDTSLGFRSARLDIAKFKACRHRFGERGYRTRLIEQPFVFSGTTTC